MQMDRSFPKLKSLTKCHDRAMNLAAPIIDLASVVMMKTDFTSTTNSSSANASPEIVKKDRFSYYLRGNRS